MLSLTLAAIILANGLTWLFVSQARTPEQVAADSRPPAPSQITVPVEVGRVDRAVPADCTLGPRHVTRPFLRGNAEDTAAVITGTPHAQGEQIDSGSVLTEVSSRPVVILPGRVPAFRTMDTGSRGIDVEQLQAALIDLGFHSGAADGRYGDSTAAAVAGLYARIGYDPVPHDPNGPESLKETEQALTDVRRKQGSSGNEADESGASITEAERSRDEAARAAAATVPLGEIVFVPETPVTLARADLAVGSSPRPEAIELTSGEKSLTCTLAARLAEKVHQGSRLTLAAGEESSVAEILDPDAAGAQPATTSVEGSDDGTEQGADSGVDSGSQPGETSGDTGSLVTVFADIPKDSAFTQGPAAIVIESGPEDSLIVPSSAIRTASDSRTVVRVGVAEDAEREVAVDIVFEADGRTAVEAADLREGDSVILGAAP